MATLVAVGGLLFVVASRVVNHRLQGVQTSVAVEHGLSSCSSWALEHMHNDAHGLSYSTACGIFPDQGPNLCLLHWQADSLPLSHLGNTRSDTLK